VGIRRRGGATPRERSGQASFWALFSACPDLLKKQGLRLRDVADVPLKPQRRTEVRRLDMMVSLGELLIPTE